MFLLCLPAFSYRDVSCYSSFDVPCHVLTLHSSLALPRHLVTPKPWRRRVTHLSPRSPLARHSLNAVSLGEGGSLPLAVSFHQNSRGRSSKKTVMELRCLMTCTRPSPRMK